MDADEAVDGRERRPPPPGKPQSGFSTSVHTDPDHAIAAKIVRGVSPVKPIDEGRLLDDLQQSPQARQTLRTCKVGFYINGRQPAPVQINEPALHGCLIGTSTAARCSRGAPAHAGAREKPELLILIRLRYSAPARTPRDRRTK